MAGFSWGDTRVAFSTICSSGILGFRGGGGGGEREREKETEMAGHPRQGLFFGLTAPGTGVSVTPVEQVH